MPIFDEQVQDHQSEWRKANIATVEWAGAEKGAIHGFYPWKIGRMVSGKELEVARGTPSQTILTEPPSGGMAGQTTSRVLGYFARTSIFHLVHPRMASLCWQVSLTPTSISESNAWTGSS
jgi:hypothetical protein